MRRGYLVALVTIIPFWMESSSLGRPCKFHSPICRITATLKAEKQQYWMHNTCCKLNYFLETSVQSPFNEWVFYKLPTIYSYYTQLSHKISQICLHYNFQSVQNAYSVLVTSTWLGALVLHPQYRIDKHNLRNILQSDRRYRRVNAKTR